MDKGISYSSLNNYLTCARKYEIEKIEGYKPSQHSSALTFGSAFDDAVNHLVEYYDKPGLLGTDGALERAQRILIDGIKCLAKCTDHYFFKNDFDYDLLTDKQDEMAKDFLINGLGYDGPHAFENLHAVLMKQVYDAGNDYSVLSENQQLFISFISAMSLKQKGIMMLEAVQQDLIPQIETVHGVQVELDERRGFIDLIVTLKGHGKYIIDIKTASRAYTEDQLTFSPQLLTYAHDQKINNIGYFVVIKNLNKNTTKECSICGHNGTGKRHKTCDNEINGSRCGGEWDVRISPEVVTQLMLGCVDETLQTQVITAMHQVDGAILTKEFPMNINACSSQYGKPCPYINYCRTGSIKNMKKD